MVHPLPARVHSSARAAAKAGRGPKPPWALVGARPPNGPVRAVRSRYRARAGLSARGRHANRPRGHRGGRPGRREPARITVGTDRGLDKLCCCAHGVMACHGPGALSHFLKVPVHWDASCAGTQAARGRVRRTREPPGRPMDHVAPNAGTSSAGIAGPPGGNWGDRIGHRRPVPRSSASAASEVPIARCPMPPMAACRCTGGAQGAIARPSSPDCAWDWAGARRYSPCSFNSEARGQRP